MKLSIFAASIVALMTISSAHAIQAPGQALLPSDGTTAVHREKPPQPIPEAVGSLIADASGEAAGHFGNKVQLAQYQDHTWNPNWGAPYNPGIIVQDNRPRGYWEYQWYYIQTKNTNGFIIVYYNLVCAGAGKRCPATSAAPSCFLAGGWYGDCDTSIPRNF